MIYLNILSQNDKREFKFLSINKILNYYLFIIFVIAIFFVCLTLGVNYFFVWNSNIFRMAIEEQGIGKTEKTISELEENIKKADQFIKLMAGLNDSKVEFSKILNELSEIRYPGISFKNISYNSVMEDKKEIYQISLDGFAEKRDNFLDFLDRLESSPYFKNVNSSLSNLVKKEDLNFRINFELEQ